MTPEEIKLINEAIHDLTSAMQMFKSYEQLSENLNFHIQPRQVQQLCRKSALRCQELRQLILCTIKGGENE